MRINRIITPNSDPSTTVLLNCMGACSHGIHAEDMVYEIFVSKTRIYDADHGSRNCLISTGSTVEEAEEQLPYALYFRPSRIACQLSLKQAL